MSVRFVIRCAAWIAVSAVPITPWIPWVAGQNAASIDKLDWMAGCWEGELAGGDFLFEEVWLEPRGGVMLGVSHILQEDTVVEYEFLRIAEEDEALVFLVSPENQPPRLYKASEVGVGAVTFVSTEGGAPQQLQFRQESADILSSRFESDRQGQIQNIEISLRRMRCPH